MKKTIIAIAALAACTALYAAALPKEISPQPEVNTPPVTAAEPTVTEQMQREENISPSAIEVQTPLVEVKQATKETSVESMPPLTRPTPPPQTSKPQGGSVNEAGEVYVPSFGWIASSREKYGALEDMYENGNKIGMMGGTPKNGNANADGDIYVEGFGWSKSEYEGEVIRDETIYENGNKVGIMGNSEPQSGDINVAGEMYVPGFGYMASSGPSTWSIREGMKENGNKVGEM